MWWLWRVASVNRAILERRRTVVGGGASRQVTGGPGPGTARRRRRERRVGVSAVDGVDGVIIAASGLVSWLGSDWLVGDAGFGVARVDVVEDRPL